MKYGDRVAEVRAKASGEDGREGDFGDEHHRRATAPERVAHRAYVDCCLAAARHAVQEEGRVLACLLRLVYLSERVYLGLGQTELVARGEPCARQRVAPHFADEDFDDAATLKRLDGRGARVRGFK